MKGRSTWRGRAGLCALGFALASGMGLLAPVSAWAQIKAPAPAPGAPVSEPMSADARDMQAWVRRSGDAGGRPYAVVDKRHARIHVFNAEGVLEGSTSVLLGASPGDHIVPGVGQRAQTGTLRADERTTPAGRFVAEPGVNLGGEHVVWVDYESAFAIHRVRPGRAQQARLVRLASDGTEDKRVSDGCVVVPVAFYTQVVQRVLGQRRSVVYVLPETRPARELFAVD